jgi:hypothetical protein
MKIKAKQIDFTSFSFINIVEVAATTYTHAQESPHDLLYYEGGNQATITLPDPSNTPAGSIVSIKRLTTASITIEPYTQNGTVEEAATYTLNNDSGVCFILLDASTDRWVGLSIFH